MEGTDPTEKEGGGLHRTGGGRAERVLGSCATKGPVTCEVGTLESSPELRLTKFQRQVLSHRLFCEQDAEAIQGKGRRTQSLGAEGASRCAA